MEQRVANKKTCTPPNPHLFCGDARGEPRDHAGWRDHPEVQQRRRKTHVLSCSVLSERDSGVLSARETMFSHSIEALGFAAISTRRTAMMDGQDNRLLLERYLAW